MTCYTCGQHIGNVKRDKILAIPISELHVRCIKCFWPVVNDPRFVNERGECRMCFLQEKEVEQHV